jgi:signal transduction histidine kinase
MDSWLSGLALGLIAGLALAGVAGWALSRRIIARSIALRDRNRQVERLAELGTLTGGLAHEIKNPLSTVQLNLQLLQEDLAAEPHTPPRALSRLTTVNREALRLRETLDDFLRYAGRIELQPERVDLSQLLGDLVDFLSPQAQLARVHLRQTPSPAPVVADVDPKLIKQAALNLMLNAIQAMPAGGELMVGAERTPQGAAVHVTDTGPGLSPEDQSKIFQAYYSKRKGGTGLGLAMTQRIAKEHGGEVTVQSEVGKGSRFSIVLPAGAGAGSGFRVQGSG